MFYLRLLGNVVSGWLMAKAAAKAAEQLERGSDHTFLSAKLKSARYFADITLSESGQPQVRGGWRRIARV